MFINLFSQHDEHFYQYEREKGDVQSKGEVQRENGHPNRIVLVQTQTGVMDQ